MNFNALKNKKKPERTLPRQLIIISFTKMCAALIGYGLLVKVRPRVSERYSEKANPVY